MAGDAFFHDVFGGDGGAGGAGNDLERYPS
jgi:hypothetical protein